MLPARRERAGTTADRSTAGLSPLALLVSLMFWGWAWGPVGLLLSVPLTMSVKLLLENFDRARWLAVLISRAPNASG